MIGLRSLRNRLAVVFGLIVLGAIGTIYLTVTPRLDQLRGQVDRMRTLATELLDLSRLEAGALELRPEPTDLGQLAREVAGEFTPAPQRHDSVVVLDLEREPIELDCDPERVAQVLRILLDNALV